MVHLFVIPLWIDYASIIGVVLLALWKGDWRGRLLGAYCGIAALAAFACAHSSCSQFNYAPYLGWRNLPQDLIALAVCFICVRRADRYWVIWASSIRLAILGMDLLGLYYPFTGWAYVSARLVWWYLFAATLVWGVCDAMISRRADRAQVRA